MSHKCYGRDTMPSVSVTGGEGVTPLEGQDADSEGGLKDELDPKAGANEFDRRTEHPSGHHGNGEKGETGDVQGQHPCFSCSERREPPREWLARRKVCFRKKYPVAQHQVVGKDGIRKMKSEGAGRSGKERRGMKMRWEEGQPGHWNTRTPWVPLAECGLCFNL